MDYARDGRDIIRPSVKDMTITDRGPHDMTDSLEDTIILACTAHRGQVDKGGAPYILHPLRVMLAVSGDERRIAAVLHDVVEDCGIDPATIADRFGDGVAQAVVALSRN